MQGNPIYLIILLALTGVALLLVELKIPRWRAMAGGLAVNLIAAAAILIVQRIYEQQWNSTPYLIGGVASLLLTLPFILVRQGRLGKELAAKSAQIDELSRENVDRESVLKELSERSKSLPNSGITKYARNYAEHFQPVTNREFGEYVRSFVTSSPPGTRFKLVGIDWTELFGAAISATSERYFGLLQDKRTTFQLVLLDPRSRVGLEKRLSEFDLVTNGKQRYVPNHPDRIFGKVLGSVSMIADYHSNFPNQFQYKFTEDIPMVCALLNGTEAIFYLYSRCHKGWDSPVFVAQKVPNGIYEFIEEYFDYLWLHPKPVLTDAAWADQKKRLQRTFEEFDRVLAASCAGPLHATCAKP